MQTRLMLAGAFIAFVLAFTAGFGFTEDAPAEPEPMSEAEVWAKMAQLARPSEMHTTVLARLVGTWKTEGKAITGMGEIPITGTSTNTSILGGRFVQVNYEGPFMGGMFEGVGLIGFDNLAKVFEMTWVMTMATSMDVMSGTWDAETQTLTWRGKSTMPNGVSYAKRTAARWEGDDKFVEQAFATGPDGVERMEMELTYTRVE